MNNTLRQIVTAAFVVAATAPGVASAASAGVGDTFVFRVVNGYNRETVGRVQYQIDRIDADRTTVSMSSDISALGSPQTAIYTKEGNWLRHTLINKDQPVEYEFSPPYPAYVFPLETGKSWSTRVTATNPVTGQRNSVRVDGDVLGSERISTPAGEFDTIKVRRRVYAGDWETFKKETQIVEIEWYAPALGRAVKAESNSGYVDPGRCTSDSMTYNFPPGSGQAGMMRVNAAKPVMGRDGARAAGPNWSYDYLACDPMRGEWNMFELIEIRPAKP